MVDKETRLSRGFGFVTFRNATSAFCALHTANWVDFKEVDCKKAVRDPPGQTLKVFVGGLPVSCDNIKLMKYFGRFGRIESAVVMMDARTNRHRGFGYVTFSDTSAVKAALDMYKENRIDGKWIEVKRCIPQDAVRCLELQRRADRAAEGQRVATEVAQEMVTEVEGAACYNGGPGYKVDGACRNGGGPSNQRLGRFPQLAQWALAFGPVLLAFLISRNTCLKLF